MADRTTADPGTRVDPADFGARVVDSATAARIDPTLPDGTTSTRLESDPRYAALEESLRKHVFSNWRGLNGSFLHKPNTVDSESLKRLIAAAITNMNNVHAGRPVSSRLDFLAFALKDGSLNPDLVNNYKTELESAIADYQRNLPTLDASATLAGRGSGAPAGGTTPELETPPIAAPLAPTDAGVTIGAEAEDAVAEEAAHADPAISTPSPSGAHASRGIDLAGLFGDTADTEAASLLDDKSFKRAMGDNAIRIITAKFPHLLRQPALEAEARRLAETEWATERPEGEEPDETRGDYNAWFQKKLANPDDPAIKRLQDKFKESWPYATDVHPDGSKSGILNFSIGTKPGSGKLTGHQYVIFHDHQQNQYFFDGTSCSVQLRGRTKTKDGIVEGEKFGKKHAEYVVSALVKERSGRKNPDGSVKDYTMTLSSQGLFDRDYCRSLCILQTLKEAQMAGSMSALTVIEKSFLMGGKKLDQIPKGYLNEDALLEYPDANELIEKYNNRKTPAITAEAGPAGPAASEPAAAVPAAASAEPTVEVRRGASATGVPARTATPSPRV